MNKNILFGVSLMLSSLIASGAALSTVTGKLVSITPALYVIESAKSIYHVKRSALTPQQTAKLSEVNKEVSVSVPFAAIERVKAKN